MSQKRNADLTWGDLIVAITDDFTPFIPDPVTSYRIRRADVSDLLSVTRCDLASTRVISNR
jgi:hypothetical protein